MSSGLLTETADYDTPGSWGPASEGWPSLPDPDEQIRAFVIRTKIIPYGSYVTVDSSLRVHPDHFHVLRKAYTATNGKGAIGAGCGEDTQ